MQKFLFLLIMSACTIITQQPPTQEELNHQLKSLFGWVSPLGQKQGTPEELKQLLVQGADPNYIVDRYYDNTLLDTLAYNDKYLEQLKILIAHGSRINKLKICGETLSNSSALHAAAIGGAPQNATELLQAGADINAMTIYYDTPLHLLIKYTKHAKLSEKRNAEFPLFLQTAKILIDHGARMDIARGKKAPDTTYSPIQSAIDENLPELVELFRKKIAEVEYQKLNELKTKHSNTYVALLPIELLVEVSYMMSSEEFLTQQKGRP